MVPSCRKMQFDFAYAGRVDLIALTIGAHYSRPPPASRPPGAPSSSSCAVTVHGPPKGFTVVNPNGRYFLGSGKEVTFVPWGPQVLRPGQARLNPGRLPARGQGRDPIISSHLIVISHHHPIIRSRPRPPPPSTGSSTPTVTAAPASRRGGQPRALRPL